MYFFFFFFFSLLFFFLSIFSMFVNNNIKTHLKEFASHRARRWYYHATTFLVSRFRAARSLATRESLQFGRGSRRFLVTGRPLTSRPRLDQRRAEKKVKRERYGTWTKRSVEFPPRVRSPAYPCTRMPRPSSDRELLPTRCETTVRTRWTCENKENEQMWYKL